MGMRLFGGGSSAGRTGSSSIRVGSSGRGGTGLLPGDPNPERFEIVSIEAFGADQRVSLAVIRWPDAKNYDGTKVAVYRATPEQLRTAKRLDPHFQEGRGPLVPVARFEPTPEGVGMARYFATTLAVVGT